MAVTRRELLRTAGRAGALGLGGLALSARGAEAAAGWAARGEQAAAVAPAMIRLDSNENPVGPLPEAIEAMKSAMVHGGRYPRFMGSGLVEDLARLYATSPGCITLGAGSGEILRMAVDAFTTPARGLLTALPTFESPAGRARQLGRPLVEVPVNPSSLQIELDAIADKAREAGLVFLCNPNNPTGALHSGKAMRECLARIRRSAPDAVVLVDEAYHEYVDDSSYESMVGLALADPGVLVSRTFSKAYGMAGIRLGYAVGSPATIARLGEWRLGNSVNLLAFAAGRAALSAAAQPAIAAERARNAEARAFTAKLFAGLGFTVAPSQANFVFVDIRRDARGFMSGCRARGVMVGRPFSPFDTWARVSVGTMDEMRRAAEVFKQVLAAAPSAA
jgi:histidinol-phosphate aminotransferase